MEAPRIPTNIRIGTRTDRKQTMDDKCNYPLSMSDDSTFRSDSLISKKIILPICTALLFSGSYISANYTTVDLGPAAASLMRYSVALIFLCSMMVHYKLSSLRIERKHIIRLVVLGLSGIVGYHYFFLLSLRYTQVANTAIINASSPILTGIAAAIFIRERLSRKNYAGVFIAFLGVIVLLTRGSIRNIVELRINIGDAIMLLATLSWVVYALVVKGLLNRYSSYTLTFYATLLGVVFLFFLALKEDFIGQIRAMSISSLWAIFYMGVCASGLGYLLYGLSIREIGPTRTSSFVYSFVPILVTILAFIFFRQPITAVMLWSILCIMVGLRLILKEEKEF